MTTNTSEGNLIYLLSGGIGDFLQCLPFLLSPNGVSARVVVLSHQESASRLFSEFGIRIERFAVFTDVDSQNRALADFRQLGELVSCPRAQYFDQDPFPRRPRIFANSRKTIGVHLGGSTYSIETQKKWGMVTKNLPKALLAQLATLPHNFLVFGSKVELAQLGIAATDNIATISFENVFESLSYVSQCDVLVGSDSAFKTAAVMLRIPTMVWMGDYKDQTRDDLFITPYVTAGLMEVYRYHSLADAKQIDEGLLKTRSFLDSVFFPKPARIWSTLFHSNFGPMILNLRDKGVSQDILQSGYFESEQISLLSELVRFLLTRSRSLVIYDVGANVGTHTLALAKLDPNRIRVRAFEVQSKIFYMLCGSVILNGLANVDCHHLAVGSAEGGVLEVSVPNYSGTYNYGGFEVERIEKSDNQDMPKPHRERVSMVTLDSFGEFVDLLKIDVEGMEEKVLLGAHRLFEKSQPICLIEVFKSNLENLVAFFKSRGYIGYSTHQDLLAIPAKLEIHINRLERLF